MKLRNPRGEKGQAALEFALLVPFLLGFILFIVDLGFFAFSYVSMTNAVREGARCAAVGGTSSANGAIEQRVETTSGLNAASVTFPGGAATYTPGSPTVGGSVRVQASYTYSWITPVGLIPSIPGTTTFSKAATMRMETATTTKSSC
jgi:Flp pilus assembly protein TadG